MDDKEAFENIIDEVYSYNMDRVEKNVKSKLFDLQKEREMLIDKNRVWHKEIGGLTRQERILKNQTEINILKEMLK